ncbi:hypothetical protein AURDEDRAFT_175972 [Auricularia subglabra TFB-10046 SS5]|nr:hypothetical protein AURDEDRAFT_175972 [Auricularia subglabra TFB-10046 SS5]
MEARNRHEKHISRACSRCQRRKIRCNGAVPSCGACVTAKKECKPPATPDRRTAAGREDPGLLARVAKLDEENKILAQENALLRAELAKRDHAFGCDPQQATGLEAFDTSPYGVAAPPSILVPCDGRGAALATYAPPYDAPVLPFPYAAQAGPYLHPAPAAPPTGPLILGPELDYIGVTGWI